MIELVRRAGWLALAMLPSAAMAGDPDGEAFFEAKVRPILVARCAECHGDAAKPKGGLRLTSREAILAGGDSGPAAVPGDLRQSPIVDALHYVDEPRMPPKGKLPDDEIAILERWVGRGMPWAEAVATPGPAPGGVFRVTEEHRRFWAFRPVRAVDPPPVGLPDWAANPIDRFILARLETEGLGPAPDADRSTLIRRVTFDLTGLPPTPDEVAAFRDDALPGAFERVVDRLLASPAYGQRWGRHWLDVVRYADSRDVRGVGGSDDIGEAWRYRDWVVDALNRDLPYDRFILEQVAGDLLPGPVPGDINPGGMVATGLLTIGEWGTGDADKEKMLTDIVADQVDVVTRGFLGLTVACARCHDHKFDPIPTADYYGLAGIFFSTRILPGPGAKTASSPMLRTPIATRAHRRAIEDHARKLAGAQADLEAARASARGAVARSLVPRLRDLLVAADGRGGPPSPDLPAFAVRKWAACLGADDGRILKRPMVDVQGRKGVHFWAGQPDPPWVGVNTNLDPVAISTLTLPPRSVNLHPGTSQPAAIRWRSPIAGPVRVVGSLADADKNGGNGVAWTVSVRRGRDRTELASATLDNGGSMPLRGDALARVDVGPGDLIELTVDPRGDYSFDTTTITLRIERPGDEAGSWDLAADLLPDLLKANPHADRLGHADVWELVEVAPARLARPLPDHSAWADWDRSVAANLPATAAADAFARRVEADPGLAEALVGDRGPFRPDPTDDPAPLPESARQDVARLQAGVDRVKAEAPPPIPLALSAAEGGVPKSSYEGFHDAPIQVRGDYRRPGPVVPRHFPIVLAGEGAPPTIAPGSSGRLELARWIASADNPMTARVMVNRAWQGHFGTGLVRTPGNFGKLGEPPTHPELLDWLAARFVADGWSLKRLHRSMVTSRTYRQTSSPSEGTRKADPDNRLWGRMNRRRLEAEAVRDSLLAVAGKVDPGLGGPATRDFNSPRRTLYQMTIRSDRSSFGPLFDAADSSAMVDRRVVSTVAPQALFLMNHPFVLDQAKALGRRLRESAGDDRGRIGRAYLLLFGRVPTAEEVAIGRELLARVEESEESADRAWEAYAQVLLCSNEFLYVD